MVVQETQRPPLAASPIHAQKLQRDPATCGFMPRDSHGAIQDPLRTSKRPIRAEYPAFVLIQIGR